ncbi:MAG: hypothetical protein IPL33_15730 [Sphingobacteriales bacterium]|nr:hypothetical protein [Sphingobacteriales bacterium]MCC7222754.1 hypothetical protein [Chitinophagales bacterium]
MRPLSQNATNFVPFLLEGAAVGEIVGVLPYNCNIFSYFAFDQTTLPA